MLTTELYTTANFYTSKLFLDLQNLNRGKPKYQLLAGHSIFCNLYNIISDVCSMRHYALCTMYTMRTTELPLYTTAKQDAKTEKLRHR
jgi:hypothetical protein